MRKPLTVIIVTLSIVCTLKGACQYTLFDVGGVALYGFQCIKCYVCRRCQRWYLWLLHNIVYRVMLLILLMSKGCCTLYTMASCPSQGEGYLKSLPSCGFSGSPLVRGGSFVKFLGLVNYKGDCRQDAQSIPNS